MIGPRVLGLVQFDGFVAVMFTIGMVMKLFVAGIKLEFGEIKGARLSCSF